MTRRQLIAQALRISSKALFFFFLGTFATELIFATNPGNMTVAGTSFSIAFYVYITIFDLVRFFWVGFIIIASGAVLLAFSKYKFIPVVLAAYWFAFQQYIMQSQDLMIYYKSTYACHSGYFHGMYTYACPLTSLISGHPNIPLQLDVFTPIALMLACIFYGLWRSGSGIVSSLLETLTLGSGLVCVFELLLWEFQGSWMVKQITDYQGLLYSGQFTNYDLLGTAASIFALALVARICLPRFKERIRMARILSWPEAESAPNIISD